MITPSTPPLIALYGRGLLYQTVYRHLEQFNTTHPVQDLDFTESASSYALLIYCDDSYDLHIQREVNQRCLQLGIPWLRVCTDFEQGIIGPWVVPGVPGCGVCADWRVHATMKDVVDTIPLYNMVNDARMLHFYPQAWFTTWSLDSIACLVAQEVELGLAQPAQALTHQALLTVDLARLHSQRHTFLPEPECPACGSIPPDTADRATITLEKRPKLAPETYRVRLLTALTKDLFATYVDPYAGIIHALSRKTQHSLASAVSEASINQEQGSMSLIGIGRTLNYAQSELSAITEALERYGGQRPKGKLTMVRASYHQLVEQGLAVLNPAILGLHSREQYMRPHYAYVPYHHDLIFSWVWGYSFQRQCPILVPEQVAYYGLRHPVSTAPGPFFLYEISNGCALGNCLEEAIFYGMLEVAERDAFLLTWYTQFEAPRLDLRSARDPLVNLLVEHLEHATGCTISAFDITYDHAIPCCWVMAVDEQNRVDMPKVLCAAGSHPDPEQAVINALEELDNMIKMPSLWFQRQREHAQVMLADPYAVNEMGDHSSLYFLPEAFERLSFLTNSQQLHTFEERYRDTKCHLVHEDLRDDLNDLINHYLRRDFDVIVVEQTSAEHAAQQFCCTKVLIPGMLPMTFGHQYRRISGLPRLYSLLHTLDYRPGPLTEAQINPFPHPFP